jgi:hypothetical protein
LAVAAEPTATQEVADGQEMPVSWLVITPDGAGVACSAQLVPFHASASGALLPLAPVPPAAVQAPVPAQARAASAPPPLGLGTVCVAQLAPFHSSAAGWPLAVWRPPGSRARWCQRAGEAQHGKQHDKDASHR